jgi:endonuclease/exonuclease/phosphatase family metal-dependent hydrolase
MLAPPAAAVRPEAVAAVGRTRSWVAPVAIAGAALVGVALLATWLRRPEPAPTGPPGVATNDQPTPEPGPTTTSPVPPAAPDPVRIGQLNAGNLFDAVDAPRVQDTVLTTAQLDAKLGKLALVIRDTMGAPDVVALQEVEHVDVLRALADHPHLRELGYEPLLVEGSDPRGIDVGYLYRPARLDLVALEQRRTTYVSPAGRNIQLFTRPPLVATFRPRAGAEDAAAGASFTLVNNHFTSRLQGEAGASKRLLQAAFVASIADGRAGVANLDPSRTIVLGDLNEGLGDPAYRSLVAPAIDGAPVPLVNVLLRLPDADRYSWRDGSRRELLDHVLVAPALDPAVLEVAVPHVNTTATAADRRDPASPAGSSDHDPVVVTLAG